MSQADKKVPFRGAAPPVVTFRETAAGRETLAAIAEDSLEVRHPMAHRGPAATKHYGDRISNAPGAVSPKTARALDDAPEVSFVMVPAGRATYAAIHGELRSEGPEIEVHPAAEADTDEELNVHALDIEQQFSFIVRAHSRYLKTARAKNRLVEQRLLHAMPGVHREDITRIAVESHGDGASMVRVWARVQAPRSY